VIAPKPERGLTGTDRKLIDRIFRHALSLPAPDRATYVASQCRGNSALTCHIRALLDLSAAPDGDPEQTFSKAREEFWQSALATDKNVGEDLSGQQIGAWRIERRLARGGLATVYLARRDDGAFNQRVAFKVLRRGLDTDDLIARFRVERQILSLLDHPGIAGILDGGALDDGRPYLVMEYVDGLPITAWCEKHTTGTKNRIRLLIEVLLALQHAHQRLVLHRDIKPSNILVSADGRAVLLDFGIAKLLDPDAMPGVSTLTRTGISLLTPGYGSPEQRNGATITTASDIYQAGLVLFELLAGRVPPIRDHASPEASPPCPSGSLRDPSLKAAVRGDLDAIVCKAMHPDPSRRYASANEMVADLERYLDGRPVIARPDTLRYRIAKYNKRKPWILPSIAAATLAVAGYIVTLTLYSTELRTEQRRAEAAEEFMVNLLQSADPFAPADPGRGSRITVLEAVDIGVERLQSGRYDDPRLRASLLASIASVYGNLDQHQKAIDLREEALVLERELHDPPSRQVLASVSMLASQYGALGDYRRARQYADEGVGIATRLYQSGHAAIGAAEAAVADIHNATGDRSLAKPLYGAAIRKLRSNPESYSRPLIGALTTLARYASDEGLHANALQMLDEARRLATRVHGPDSLSAAEVHTQAATSFSIAGDYAPAEAEFGAAISIYESRLGRNHSVTMRALNNLGILYNSMRDFSRAEDTHREILEYALHTYGNEHRQAGNAYQNLATAIARQGRYEDAIPLHHRALEAYHAYSDHNIPELAYPLISLALAELQTGDAAKAGQHAGKALEHLLAAGAGKYAVGVATCLLGLSLKAQGQTVEGAALTDDSDRLLASIAIPEPYRTLCAPAP